MKINLFWTVPVALLTVASARAEVAVGEIFSDNMVLQRDVPVLLWGTAQPGENIALTFAGQTKTGIADAGGRWELELDPLKPNSVPAAMTIKGEHSVTLKNILVGDVWVCSGQSNMAYPMADMGDWRTGVLNPEEEIAGADYPLIRLNGIENRQWEVCTPQAVRAFSAVGYFFGQKLHSELNIPIGLIGRAIGGTPIEHWIPREEMLHNSYCLPLMERAKDPAILGQIRQWQEDIGHWHEEWQAWKIAREQGQNPKPTRPAPQMSDQVQRHIFYLNPGTLYEREIDPLTSCPVRGVIWYQGEGNAKSTFTAYGYRNLLPLLITSWRRKWQQDRLPFYWVQLPIYRPGVAWHVIRESMLESMQLPNTGMAVTIDLDERDNLHPENKKPVGERLALWALADTYGKSVVCSGPLYRDCVIEGDKVSVGFDHAAQGLKSRDGGPLRCFQIAGGDRKFVPARAEIDGARVLVSSEKVTERHAVRFCFGDDEIPNLVNSAGLPASPFRTDRWEIDAGREDS